MPGCSILARMVENFSVGGGGFDTWNPDLRSRLVVDDLPPENRVIPLKLDHDGSEIIHPTWLLIGNRFFDYMIDN